MYKHGKHIQRRALSGQFERSTLQNTFGLNTAICAWCGSLNAYEQYTYTTINGFTERVRNAAPVCCENCQRDLNESPLSAFNTLIMLG